MQVADLSRLTGIEKHDIGCLLLKCKTDGISPRDLVLKSGILGQYQWAAKEIMLLARSVVRGKHTRTTLAKKLG
jgi:hypothetical protein